MEKTPGAGRTARRGKIGKADSPYLAPLNENFNADPARLGYLSRLVDSQAHEAERFDDMRLAAERYRSDPSPANAMSAHAAARRYVVRR